ncbi:MAG: glycosyltransferase family 4 protein [Pseudomonadota bacterium]
MKITFYCESGGFGGMEKVLIDTAIELSKSNYRVTVLMNSINENPPFEEKLIKNNCNYVNIDIKHISFIKNIFRAYRLFTKYPSDIIHFYLGSVTSCQSAILGAFLAKLVLKKTKINLIATEQLDSMLKIDKISFASKILKNITLKILSHIICVSKSVHQNLISFFNINKNKTSIIYNSIIVNDYKNHVLSKKREDLLPETNDKVVYIVPARLEPIKGHKYLIEAISQIKEKIPKAIFFFLGDGTERKNIESQIQEKKLENNIKILGFQPNVADYLKVSDVFVLTSLSEGLPLSVIEGMACELPIIGSRISGITELVVDGKNGYLPPAKDYQKISEYLLKLYLDPDLRNKMGEESFLIAKNKFDLKEITKEIDSVYKKLN